MIDTSVKSHWFTIIAIGWIVGFISCCLAIDNIPRLRHAVTDQDYPTTEMVQLKKETRELNSKIIELTEKANQVSHCRCHPGGHKEGAAPTGIRSEVDKQQ